MANSQHYPSVVLLDNENNPITPLVDITSIYTDAKTKEDAGVLTGPLRFQSIDDDIDIDTETGNLVYYPDKDKENKQELFFILDIKVENRNIIMKTAKASKIFSLWSDLSIWDALYEADGERLIGADGEEFEVKKF